MAITKSTTTVPYGPAHVTLDGVTIGYTKGGIEFSLGKELMAITVDDFGSTPVNFVPTGFSCTVKMMLAQNEVQIIAELLPEGTLTSTTKLQLNATVGTATGSTASTLLIHPLSKSASDRTQDIVLWKAVCTEISPLKIVFDDQPVWEATFTAIVDVSSSNRLVTLGDSTVA